MARKLLIAVDGSGTSDHALVWASTCIRPGDELHVVTVMPPINYSVYPVAPVATAAAVSAITHQWEVQRKHDEQEAAQVLRAAVTVCMNQGVAREQLHAHALPAAGGASGVAESIVEFCRALKGDLVVLGSRGMGAMRRSLLSLVGLGSVSDYCVNNLHVPVVVVRSDYQEQPAGQPRTVVLALDDSPHAVLARDWAGSTQVQPGQDRVHVVAVALSMVYPILDETSPAVAALEAQHWEANVQRCLDIARDLAARHAGELEAMAGLEAGSVVQAALLPEGGASDVGASICKYACDHKADLVVVGSRGMGSFKASVMGFVGLGSVSSYLLHHLACPVAVVKASEEAAAAAATATATATAAPAVHGGGGAAAADAKED